MYDKGFDLKYGPRYYLTILRYHTLLSFNKFQKFKIKKAPNEFLLYSYLHKCTVHISTLKLYLNLYPDVIILYSNVQQGRSSLHRRPHLEIRPLCIGLSLEKLVLSH